MQEIKECLACGGIFIDGIFRVSVGKPLIQKDFAARVCQFNKQDPNTKPCINPYFTDEYRDTTEKLDSGYPTEEGVDTKTITILDEVFSEPEFKELLSLSNFNMKDFEDIETLLKKPD